MPTYMNQRVRTYIRTRVQACVSLSLSLFLCLSPLPSPVLPRRQFGDTVWAVCTPASAPEF